MTHRISLSVTIVASVKCRVLFFAIAFLLLSVQSAFTQPTPDADKAIKDAIAMLKKRSDACKNASDRLKIRLAVKSLAEIISPKVKPPEPIAADPAKVTRANYTKIRQLMSIEEVERILGAGKEKSFAGNQKTIVWQGTDVTIVATFTDANRPGFVTQLIRKSISEK